MRSRLLEFKEESVIIDCLFEIGCCCDFYCYCVLGEVTLKREGSE